MTVGRDRDRDRGCEDRACYTDPVSHPSMCLFYRHNDFECPKDTKKTKICNAYQKNEESRVRRGLPCLSMYQF